MGVELGEGEEVRAFVVDHLGVGGVSLDDVGVGEGFAEEVDCVFDGMAGGGFVGVERDVLTLGEFG